MIFLFIFSEWTGSIIVAGEKIPWKAIFKHCRACWILIIVAIDWNAGENLVPKSSCKGKTSSGGWNWKDSHGTNGPYNGHCYLHEHGKYWLFCSTRRHDWQWNASVVTKKSNDKLICHITSPSHYITNIQTLSHTHKNRSWRQAICIR